MVGQEANKKAVPAAGGEGDGGAKKRRKKAPGAKKGVAPDSEQQQWEDARRHAQRELQQLVVRLRAEGADPATIEKEKREFKARQNFRTPEAVSKKQEKLERYNELKQERRNKTEKKAEKELGPRPTDADGKREYAMKRGAKHEVVVIPIGYKGQKDKLQRTHDLAAKVKERLASRHIDTWVDQRGKMLPGEKFRFWEEAGVRLRVEIGPRDAEAQPPTCTVSKAGKVGAVASRKQDVSLEGRDLMAALRGFGLEKAAPIADDEDYTLEEEKVADADGQGPETADSVEGNVYVPERGQKRRAELSKGGKKKRRS